MKISRIVLIPIVIIAAAQVLYGFVENRHQWWEIHIQKLSAEKERVQKNGGMDPLITGLIDKEIGRARAMLSIFESDIRGDGVLTHVTRTVAEGEITAEVRRVALPLFSIHALESMTGDTDSGTASSDARNAVQEDISRMVRTAAGSDSKQLVEKIMSEDITRNDWKNISFELFTGRLMESRKEIEDKMISSVCASVSKKLQARGSAANARELRALALQASVEYLRDFNIHGHLAGPERALALSWSWKKIRSSLERELGAYRSIAALLSDRRALSQERIRAYYRNHADLESAIFKDRRDALMSVVTARAAGHKASDASAGDIPKQPKMIPLLDEMDRLQQRQKW